MQENEISLFDPNLISNMPRLHQLNLSDNLLDHLSDDTFAKNEELELLDLSDNYLGNLTENTFKGLEVLKVSGFGVNL